MIKLRNREVKFLAQAHPARKRQSWEVKLAVWCQAPYIHWATSSTDPTANTEAALSTLGFAVLAPGWATPNLFKFSFHINQGPRMLSTAACTQVVTPDTSLFCGLSQTLGTMNPSQTLPLTSHHGLTGTLNTSGPYLTRPHRERLCWK